MGFKYPYGNSQQLNLDWLINAWKQYQEQIENAIAPQYNENDTYTDPAVVFYNHILYYNLEPIATPEPFTPEHWQSASLVEILFNWPF